MTKPVSFHTPSSIARDDIKFRIPLYQRPYACEEEQVEGLLKDLYRACRQRKTYHIGILSIAKTAGNEPRFDLIDGQQRITTLTLIGKVAAGYFADWKNFLIFSRLDLYGREEDKAFLEDKGSSAVNPKMENAIQAAKRFFECEDVKSSGREIFSRFIYENAAFFLAEVPQGYSLMEKNRQFVRMNNRGKQLERHEILKARLLSVEMIPDGSKRAGLLRDWNKMVSCLNGSGAKEEAKNQSLEDILNASSEKDQANLETEILYRPIATIPEFLLIALARFLAPDVSQVKEELLTTFSVLRNGPDIERFMRVLQEQLRILKKFFIFIAQTGVQAGNYELGMTTEDKKKGSAFVFPDKAQEECEVRLIAIQSFLYVSTEPHHWLPPAFDWCQQYLDLPIDAAGFIKELERIDNDLIGGKRSLGSIPELSDMSYDKHPRRYWFYRLDYELWKLYRFPQQPANLWDEFLAKANTDKGILALARDFQFRRCGSIEHIKPQKPQEGNSEPDHQFGNLALISSSRNSKFSNTHPDGKKGDIVASKYTESLKMLHFLFSNQNAVEEGTEMYKILYDAVIGTPPVGAT